MPRVALELKPIDMGQGQTPVPLGPEPTTGRNSTNTGASAGERHPLGSGLCPSPQGEFCRGGSFPDAGHGNALEALCGHGSKPSPESPKETSPESPKETEQRAWDVHMAVGQEPGYPS